MELILDRAGGLWVMRSSWRDRLRSALHGERIDRQLAAGAAAEESVVASVRGRFLTGGRMRRTLLAGIDSAIGLATDRPSRVLPLVPLDRAAVRAALPELTELRNRIATDVLPPTHAMARARLLLTDGTGPLYNPHAAVRLGDAIRDVLAAFDVR